jgi:hypothetical protein
MTKKQEDNLPAVLSNFDTILKEKGMTDEKMADALLELINWPTIKIDKNGNVHKSVDGELRLKAIQLWCKLTGVLRSAGTDELHNHLHLENVSEKKLNELTNKIK